MGAAGLLNDEDALSEAGRRRLLEAITARGGRVTVGDVVAATSARRDEVEAGLRELLTGIKGHLEVSEEGELLYRFDPALASRAAAPSTWQRVKAGAWRAFVKAFKVWIMLMLVVYAVLFAALMIAALTAGRSSDNDSRSSSRGPGLLFYFFWTSDWRRGDRYYGDRETKGKVPFYKKVFAYVFGPDAHPAEEVTRARDARRVQMIQAQRGVVTAADLVALEGITLAEAEEEMGRLLGAWGGEVTVSARGEVLYAFSELMTSAGGPIGRVKAPPMAWDQLEARPKLTGNTSGTDALISALNGFNLLAAATAPLFIFPRLGIEGVGATVGLVIIPLIFGLLFFAVPAGRALRRRADDARRVADNVRRVALDRVFAGAWAGSTVSGEVVREAVGQRTAAPEPAAASARALHEAAAEFEADVEADARAALSYRFDRLSERLSDAERVRDRLALETREPGPVVFSSDDDDGAAGERELDAFAREVEDRPNAARLDAEGAAALDAFEQALAGPQAPREDAAALDAFDEALEREQESAAEAEAGVDARGARRR